MLGRTRKVYLGNLYRIARGLAYLYLIGQGISIIIISYQEDIFTFSWNFYPRGEYIWYRTYCIGRGDCT